MSQAYGSMIQSVMGHFTRAVSLASDILKYTGDNRYLQLLEEINPGKIRVVDFDPREILARHQVIGDVMAAMVHAKRTGMDLGTCMSIGVVVGRMEASVRYFNHDMKFQDFVDLYNPGFEDTVIRTFIIEQRTRWGDIVNLNVHGITVDIRPQTKQVVLNTAKGQYTAEVCHE